MTADRRPSSPPARRRPTLHRAAPGLLLAVAGAAVSMLVNAVVPLVSALLVAVVLGMAVRNLGLVGGAVEPGLRVAARPVLRLGVVLLGLRLSVPQVLELGWGVVAVIAVTVTVSYVATLALGRALGLGRSARTLVATGTAICGAAAVAAMSAVLGRREDAEDVEEAAATAVATVTIVGTVSLAAVPALAVLLGLADDVAAMWVGASVHEVGQVVAGAGLVGAGALDVAVLTKLGRVVLLAPMVALVGLTENRRARRAAEARLAHLEVQEVVSGRPVDHPRGRPAPLVPLFVVGFLVMVLLRSVLPLPTALVDVSQLLATAMLTIAMVAMGAAVNVRVLVRSGGRALAVGALAGVVAAGVSLGGLALVG
ncbi:putative sulfate exporter family transporter [Georgenia sp. 10Sc9-8]|uniref:Sulfate exporter family transporter n=1 Tax=Georgenia halotolerans TaxID=3028317 RepID=A0ABT5TV60_9MICO|nr:putative sulfate exporter family transporter [Georgenia halotolerans]